MSAKCAHSGGVRALARASKDGQWSELPSFEAHRRRLTPQDDGERVALSPYKFNFSNSQNSLRHTSAISLAPCVRSCRFRVQICCPAICRSAKAPDRSYPRDLTGVFDINIEPARTPKLKAAGATFEDCKISAVSGRGHATPRAVQAKVADVIFDGIAML